ncbi:hypothetical protein WJX72_004453 [[Myrmecia] bisecta]|uniref:Uncharacterized protein n=1 Tax=[Myrmecia] bisecta TaxID=41462 RepID=A0AAW1PRQ3_9CHLO
MGAWAVLCSVLVLATVWRVEANFQEGEFVPTARRGQYHGTRTNWHDLLGRHCPRFGQDRLVALPIPRPVGALTIQQTYKISFSIDNDRLLTPWLTIIGKRAPAAPMLDIELTQTGDQVTAVKAKVLPVPLAFLAMHQELVDEFHNATHWPKHLLVQYRWTQAGMVEVTRGLYLLFTAGLLATFTLVINPSLLASLSNISFGSVERNATQVLLSLAEDGANSESQPGPDSIAHSWESTVLERERDDARREAADLQDRLDVMSFDLQEAHQTAANFMNEIAALEEELQVAKVLADDQMAASQAARKEAASVRADAEAQIEKLRHESWAMEARAASMQEQAGNDRLDSLISQARHMVDESCQCELLQPLQESLPLAEATADTSPFTLRRISMPNLGLSDNENSFCEGGNSGEPNTEGSRKRIRLSQGDWSELISPSLPDLHSPAPALQGCESPTMPTFRLNLPDAAQSAQNSLHGSGMEPGADLDISGPEGDDSASDSTIDSSFAFDGPIPEDDAAPAASMRTKQQHELRASRLAQLRSSGFSLLRASMSSAGTLVSERSMNHAAVVSKALSRVLHLQRERESLVQKVQALSGEHSDLAGKQRSLLSRLDEVLQENGQLRDSLAAQMRDLGALDQVQSTLQHEVDQNRRLHELEGEGLRSEITQLQMQVASSAPEPGRQLAATEAMKVLHHKLKKERGAAMRLQEDKMALQERLLALQPRAEAGAEAAAQLQQVRKDLQQERARIEQLLQDRASLATKVEHLQLGELPHVSLAQEAKEDLQAERLRIEALLQERAHLQGRMEEVAATVAASRDAAQQLEMVSKSLQAEQERSARLERQLQEAEASLAARSKEVQGLADIAHTATMDVLAVREALLQAQQQAEHLLADKLALQAQVAEPSRPAAQAGDAATTEQLQVDLQTAQASMEQLRAQNQQLLGIAVPTGRRSPLDPTAWLTGGAATPASVSSWAASLPITPAQQASPLSAIIGQAERIVQEATQSPGQALAVDLQQLQGWLEEALHHADALQSENDALRTQVQVLCQEMQLQQTCNPLLECDALRRALNMLEEVKQDSQAKQARIADFEGERRSLETRIARVQAECMQIQGARMQSSDVKQRQLRQLLEETRGLEERLAAMEAERQQLSVAQQADRVKQQQMAEACAALKDLLRIHVQRGAAERERSEGLQRDVDSLQAQLGSMQATGRQQTERILELETNFRFVQHQLQQENVDKQQQLDQATSKSSELLVRYQACLDQLSALSLERGSWQERLAASQAQCAGVEANLCTALAERDALMQQLGAAQSEHGNVVEQLAALQIQCAEQAEDLHAAVAARDALQSDLQSSAVKHDALASELRAVAAERDALAGDLPTVAAERDALASELRTVAGERDALAGDLRASAVERDVLFQEAQRALEMAVLLAAVSDQLEAQCQMVDRLALGNQGSSPDVPVSTSQAGTQAAAPEQSCPDMSDAACSPMPEKGILAQLRAQLGRLSEPGSPATPKTLAAERRTTFLQVIEKLEGMKAENGQLWHLLEGHLAAGNQLSQRAQHDGQYVATLEAERSALAQRLEAVMQERADVGSRLATAQVAVKHLQRAVTRLGSENATLISRLEKPPMPASAAQALVAAHAARGKRYKARCRQLEVDLQQLQRALDSELAASRQLRERHSMDLQAVQARLAGLAAEVQGVLGPTAADAAQQNMTWQSELTRERLHLQLQISLVCRLVQELAAKYRGLAAAGRSPAHIQPALHNKHPSMLASTPGLSLARHLRWSDDTLLHTPLGPHCKHLNQAQHGASEQWWGFQSKEGAAQSGSGQAWSAAKAPDAGADPKVQEAKRKAADIATAFLQS